MWTFFPNAFCWWYSLMFFEHLCESDIRCLLIHWAGEPWCSNNQLKEEIKKVSAECTTCQTYGKAKRKPVVCLPLATKFLECAAMDLKFYKSHIILHIIDYATRLSQSCILPSKKPAVVVGAILKTWVSVFGHARNSWHTMEGNLQTRNFSVCVNHSISM